MVRRTVDDGRQVSFSVRWAEGIWPGAWECDHEHLVNPGYDYVV